MTHTTQTADIGAMPDQLATTGKPAANGSCDLVRTPIAGLSFYSHYRTRRGRLVRTTALDVPDEEYGKGYRTGCLVVQELLAEVKRLYIGPAREDAAWLLREVLEEAFAVCEATRPEMPSRRGAAAAVINSLTELLAPVAAYCDGPKFIGTKLKRFDENDEFIAQHIAERGADFVKRMAAAKTAKRAQRAVQ